MKDILFIDDEKHILDSHYIFFTQHLRYTCECFQNPYDALESFRKANQIREPYRLVVVDYIMPKLNGVELSKLIREIDKEIPIILITGKLGNINTQGIIFEDIRQKPIPLNVLGGLIKKILK